MKLAIISDVHLGFDRGGPLEDDPFRAFQEAVEKAKGCDAILLPGDIFDERSPQPGILARAMEILEKPIFWKSETHVEKGIGKHIKASGLQRMGTPVIAIHGTHERRVKGIMNPVEALEKAGFLIHIHCNGVVLVKGEERVCVQGMSGVPEHFAEAVLKGWDAKPMDGAFNVMMIHQSVEEYMYAEHMIKAESLPKGFDLYINGHLHERNEGRVHNAPFIIPGSLIPTQLKREEANRKKSFCIFDTATATVRWVDLENQREFFFIELPHEKAEVKLREILSEKREMKPLIRISIKGGWDENAAKDIQRKFGEKCFLSFKREQKKDDEIQRRTIEEHRLSVEELGSRLLNENLAKAGLNPEFFEQVFGLLVEGKVEDAAEAVLNEGRLKGGAKKQEEEKQEAKKQEEGKHKKDIKPQRTIFSYGKP